MGGMEKLLVEFARHADRERFELHFISLTTKGAAASEIEKIGWPVSALEQQAGLQPALPFRLAKLLRRVGANILHTHNTKALLYGAPAARIAGVDGVIHTRHGQRRGATRRQTMLFNLAARWTDAIVSVSNDSSALAASQGLHAGKLVTIHNGIDLSRFTFTGPRPNSPAVTVGRISPEKDLATLLRASAIVVAQEPCFRLHIAGDGPCVAELKRLREELGLHNHVEFLGQVNEVPRLLSTASLFVLSSLTEGISLALLEAMACGLPAVATRVGGNPEVIADGETGLLVSTHAPAQLADAILKLYRAPQMGQRMGVAGRRRVETNFDVRQMVLRYESLYLQTLQSKRKLAA
jgi:glycosyltransferase involved in cell wall biosynthesis